MKKSDYGYREILKIFLSNEISRTCLFCRGTGDRRKSKFTPADPCLAARYVRLKAGEEITIKAPDFLIGDQSIIIYRDRRKFPYPQEI